MTSQALANLAKIGQLKVEPRNDAEVSRLLEATPPRWNMLGPYSHMRTVVQPTGSTAGSANWSGHFAEGSLALPKRSDSIVYETPAAL
jgi:hypothetical protein